MVADVAVEPSLGRAGGKQAPPEPGGVEDFLLRVCDGWSASGAVSCLTPKTLRQVDECFKSLTRAEKIRCLLCFVHARGQHLARSAETMQRIVDTAVIDPDQWVQGLARLLNGYPAAAAVQCAQVDNEFVYRLTEALSKAGASFSLEAPEFLTLAVGRSAPGKRPAAQPDFVFTGSLDRALLPSIKDAMQELSTVAPVPPVSGVAQADRASTAAVAAQRPQRPQPAASAGTARSSHRSSPKKKPHRQPQPAAFLSMPAEKPSGQTVLGRAKAPPRSSQHGQSHRPPSFARPGASPPAPPTLAAASRRPQTDLDGSELEAAEQAAMHQDVPPPTPLIRPATPIAEPTPSGDAGFFDSSGGDATPAPATFDEEGALPIPRRAPNVLGPPGSSADAKPRGMQVVDLQDAPTARTEEQRKMMKKRMGGFTRMGDFNTKKPRP